MILRRKGEESRGWESLKFYHRHSSKHRSFARSMGRRMALRVDRSPRAGSRDAKWLLRSRFQGYLARYQCKLPVMEALRRNRIRNKGIRELAFVGSL